MTTNNPSPPPSQSLPSLDPDLHRVTCAHAGGLHRMAYWEWGDQANPEVVVCCHGLTRGGRDFDVLALRLADRFRVICPDLIGRGKSDWVDNPALYNVPQYISDCVTLVARLGVERVHWVGNSLGGIIGMVYASLPGNPLSKLVLNDIGPVVARGGGARIGEYVGELPTFASFEEAEKSLRARMVEFGPHDDAQFRYLSRNYLIQRDGIWTFAYDPKIAIGVREAMGGGEVPPLWNYYDAITCPTLVLRGELTDVLSPETAAEMTTRGPKAQVVEIAGVGHAPTLIADDQVALVETFL